MDTCSIIIIGIGLAMDCFAVSVSKGICVKKLSIIPTLTMAFLFGFFQAAMPLISYFAGLNFIGIIKKSDHWIAFGLLALIGGKMLFEGIRKQDTECEPEIHPFSFLKLISLAIATSIDALATGIIFVPYPQIIWKSIAIIGLTSFIFSISGMMIGIRLGKGFRLKAEVLGGIILIVIGLKILIEHSLAI
ncbi:MAG: manganese efflux pump MntP family protein [Dysgonamonadaceae bacterium]